MQNETPQCQNCKKDFVIETEDFNFYEKMKVPPPTWCPECRLIRRWSFTNTWSLFWRNCDKCGERTMSMYPPEDKIEVFCPKCWWADDWDGTEYAMDYDSSRPFLEQVKELSEKTPYVALESEYLTLKNSDYSNALAWSKDCYQIFWADYCERVYYSSILRGAKDTVDSLKVFDSELCYESISLKKSYRVFYSQECDSCVDVWFSRNCYSCTNCVGCVNLRGASHCIFNVKYDKEEYEEKLKELKINNYFEIIKLKEEAEIFWNKFPYRVYSGNTLNLNVTGEYIYGCKNCKDSWQCSGAENCRWCQIITVKPAKDCYDYSGWGNNATMMYESAQVGENVNNIAFSYYSMSDCVNLQYCFWNVAGKNNFGCVNLKRKSYCILNKEYSKDEFEKLRAQIIEDMKKNPYIDKLGREFSYGEFFPLEISKFPYNKSIAMRFFPKTKEQAQAEGYGWVDGKDPVYEITLKAESLPDMITETDENILQEVIGCMNCGRGYKITKGEFDLLRKLGLPIPHECPKCRENRRFSKLNPPKLYERTCDKCGKDIITAFAPDRPETVYCEKCYQQEFA
jgi:CxxC-x17-CxxC domain-containing protein